MRPLASLLSFPSMRAYLSKWLLVGTLLLASSAMAEPAPHSVSLGFGGLRYYSTLRPSEPVWTWEAAYQRATGTEGFWRTLHVGGGLRLAWPPDKTTFPLEAFARTELRPRLGFWEPAVGLELGVSRVAFLTLRLRVPAPEIITQEDALLGPLYFAIQVAPARIRIDRFLLCGPELLWGPSGPPFGGVNRIQLGLFRAEMQL